MYRVARACNQCVRTRRAWGAVGELVVAGAAAARALTVLTWHSAHLWLGIAAPFVRTIGESGLHLRINKDFAESPCTEASATPSPFPKVERRRGGGRPL